MVFVHTDDQQLAAGFQQNSLRVRPGDEAEIAFDALPGQIIKGKVRHVIDAIATGQLQATGALRDTGGASPTEGLLPSSTLKTVSLATTSRAARRLRLRFTRHLPIT